ncbi:hypothetical protein [Vibrio metschnikovii]|uniref:hypothetical protein n=1 Tax=Vibrio metschnikovii TaxID=28172 RepID=UPI001C2FD5CE|nr:hypothetical protein [Vibrio metschnikovii]EKO3664750.1 hypothetical protein [Vibrio metschnikovii]EKO3695617.1 hypothetical protein [Vibrio metschnikovii]
MALIWLLLPCVAQGDNSKKIDLEQFFAGIGGLNQHKLDLMQTTLCLSRYITSCHLVSSSS